MDESKELKETTHIDQWIGPLLVNSASDENAQLLNNVHHGMVLLKYGRFSEEQVSNVSEQICETGPALCCGDCSPPMSLLVDAAGKLDDLERKVNPNKRWSGHAK